MATTKTERTQAIELLEKEFKEATGIYFTDFERINVEKVTKLRADFRKEGITYIVVKNTLAKKALERVNKTELSPYLKGYVGVAFAKSEPTGPAKIIRNFQKDNKDLLPVKAAYVSGAIFGQSDIAKLADLPSREVLLAQLLSVLKAPTTNLACALNGILLKFVGTLNAVVAKKEAGSN